LYELRLPSIHCEHFCTLLIVWSFDAFHKIIQTYSAVFYRICLQYCTVETSNNENTEIHPFLLHWESKVQLHRGKTFLLSRPGDISAANVLMISLSLYHLSLFLVLVSISIFLSYGRSLTVPVLKTL
jgi:hypothetical protein